MESKNCCGTTCDRLKLVAEQKAAEAFRAKVEELLTRKGLAHLLKEIGE